MKIGKRSYLLVGQGIAGSVLAWRLMKEGHTVRIVDADHHESSSMISAGIINPITGQRLALTPDYDLFLSHAMKTYREMSDELGFTAFVSKPIIRVLRSAEELARAHHLNTTAAKIYISGIHAPGYYGIGVHDPFGTLTIAQGGYLQTSLLLKALKNYFTDWQVLINEQLNYADLIISHDHVQWKAERFDQVIFCEGFKANQNPWFKDLPYNFAKGEILRVSFEGAVLPDAIMCQQQWCLPLADGTYLAGSTYDRNQLDTVTTTEGQLTILEGVASFIPSPARVLERYAAVRPVMLNQKPIIAKHPTIPQLTIFNGFASKGMLWSPYYADTFKP